MLISSRRSAVSLVCLLALLASFAMPRSALAGDDVLRDYKKRYKPSSLSTDREAVVDELAATGDVRAVDALEWCAEASRDGVLKAGQDEEKAYTKWKKVFDKLIEKETKYLDQFRKRGQPVPTKRPQFPEDIEIAPLKGDLKKAERAASEERDLLARLLLATGKLVASLKPAEQTAVQDRWQAKKLEDRDWVVRVQGWMLVQNTPTDWALQTLVSGALNEADPRVLAVILEGLGGRKSDLVLPVFRERLQDPRWLVRAAAVSGLAKTPSKETIDLLIETLEREKGRLQDDCAVALRALTGADIRTDADLWQRYWKANREAWTGPPPPPEKPKGDGLSRNPMEDLNRTEEDDPKASQTGFFGLATKSRRLVYVIDVSGSMLEPADDSSAKEKGKGKDTRTRAQLAKDELKRSVLALEDGATFNIVFFSGDVRPWKKTMVVAESETRRAAVDYIDGAEVVGGTATFDALEFAFDLATVKKGKRVEADPSGNAAVDTIILLSDGKPSLGRFTDPEKIRQQVKLWNADRRIQVHTVAFGKDAGLEFLEGLALDSGGKFLAK